MNVGQRITQKIINQNKLCSKCNNYCKVDNFVKCKLSFNKQAECMKDKRYYDEYK